MNLLTCILIAIPIGIIFIMLWIYNDYRKYKKKNKLAILLFLLFPTTLSAQYVDAGCQVSFKWLENQKGKLEYTKDGVTYKFIPNGLPMGNYNSQQLFRRYPNKLGKYAIHCGRKNLRSQIPHTGRSGNSLCNNKKPGRNKPKDWCDNLYGK